MSQAIVELPGPDELLARHCDYYAELAEQADSGLVGPDQSAWLAKLDLDYDNLRAAVGWSIDSSEAARALRVSANLTKYLSLRGKAAEGLRWIEGALKLPGLVDPALRAKALHRAGGYAFAQSDIKKAAGFCEESLRIRTELGDEEGILESTNSLAICRTRMGKREEGRAMFEEVFRRHQERGDDVSAARTLTNLANSISRPKEPEYAREIALKAVELSAKIGDKQASAVAYGNLALAEEELGNNPAAVSAEEMALALAREIGSPELTSISLYRLSKFHENAGNYEGTSIHAQEATDLFSELGIEYRAVECTLLVGWAHLRQSRTTKALASFDDGLGKASELSEREGTPFVYGLMGLAEVAVVNGAHQLAEARLWEALQALEGTDEVDRLMTAFLAIVSKLMWTIGEHARAARFAGASAALEEVKGPPVSLEFEVSKLKEVSGIVFDQEYELGSSWDRDAALLAVNEYLTTRSI